MGNYTSNHGDDREELKIMSDGRYEHDYQLGRGHGFSEGGLWSFGTISANCRGINFKNFRFGYEAANPQSRGAAGDWWVCPEIYPDGSIVLLYDPDRDLFYRKFPDSQHVRR